MDHAIAGLVRAALNRPRKTNEIGLNVTDPIKKATVLDRIEGEEWLERCSPATREILETAGKIRRFGDGEYISRRGEAVPYLSTVLSGTLEVSISSYEGRRHVLGFIGEGQLVNLIPVMDEQVAIHDFSSHGTSELLMIPRETFTSAAASDTSLSRYLMRLLCLRSRTLYDRLADFSLLSVRIRCARTLLSLVPSKTDGSEQTRHILQITQTEFADMVGTSRQTVNQELRRLQDEGSITIGYSSITINSIPALRADCNATY